MGVFYLIFFIFSRYSFHYINNITLCMNSAVLNLMLIDELHGYLIYGRNGHRYNWLIKLLFSVLEYEHRSSSQIVW